MKPQNLILTPELRKASKSPSGNLIKGTIKETKPLLLELLKDEKIIAAVGDVITEVLISIGINPYIIITDGKTKRKELSKWKRYEGYKEIRTKNEAGEISKEAWIVIQEAIHDISENNKTHIMIEGEEDLLVVPLQVELPDDSIIIFGMPNEGAVIRMVNPESRSYFIDYLSKMKRLD